jgi:hypothetical protein
VPLFEQRLRSRPSETVCGTGDEDACDEMGAAGFEPATSRV